MEVLSKMVPLSVRGTGECANTCKRDGRSEGTHA